MSKLAWGNQPSAESIPKQRSQRLLAKTVVKADSERAAVSACSEKMSTKTRKQKDEDGSPKRCE